MNNMLTYVLCTFISVQLLDSVQSIIIIHISWFAGSVMRQRYKHHFSSNSALQGDEIGTAKVSGFRIQQSQMKMALSKGRFIQL